MLKMLNKTIPLSLALVLALPAWAFNGEEIPAGEDAATRQIVQMAEATVRVAAAKNGSARRDAHVKAHGCVQAEFSVLPKLPEEFRVGIFAEARAYPAWIRYSNGSGKSQDDAVGDGRGMAVKLMNVPRSESGEQDFVMINHPVFVVRNAADYVEFQTAIENGSPTRFFFPGLNPLAFRLHELGIVNAIKGKTLTNPLNSRYWSMTPYLFGDTAMKFAARPCAAASPFAETGSPDFLRDNLRKHLGQDEACFDFQVQRRSNPQAMPIEDPTVEWAEQDSPFVTVARITIPKQAFDSPAQMAFCENLSFTPWHALAEHRPLGGINRMRKALYDTVSRVRHELNGQVAK